MKNVSKNVFLNALVCPSLGWLLRSGEPIEQLSEEALSLAERFRIDQGAEIGGRARELYPQGCCASVEVGHLALGKNATTPPGEDIIKPNQEG